LDLNKYVIAILMSNRVDSKSLRSQDSRAGTHVDEGRAGLLSLSSQTIALLWSSLFVVVVVSLEDPIRLSLIFFNPSMGDGEEEETSSIWTSS
jgi:hypothetical protein